MTRHRPPSWKPLPVGQAPAERAAFERHTRFLSESNVSSRAKLNKLREAPVHCNCGWCNSEILDVPIHPRHCQQRSHQMPRASWGKSEPVVSLQLHTCGSPVSAPARQLDRVGRRFWLLNFLEPTPVATGNRCLSAGMASSAVKSWSRLHKAVGGFPFEPRTETIGRFGNTTTLSQTAC